MTHTANNRTERSSQITAVLVTFNSADVIVDSLQSLQQCPTIEQIIVVDNASSDSTVSLIATNFPNVRMIANSENMGFGSANNLGLEQVTTDFALVLNPDSVVTNKAMSTLLQVAAVHENAAIVGPLLQNPAKPKSKVRIGSVWDPRKIVVPANTDLNVDFLSGAAMLMRMSLVRNSGYFDPNIFLFYEDDDICRSARRSGHELVLTTKAKITHLMGKSTLPNPELIAFKQCHFTWSRMYLEEKELGKTAALALAKRVRKETLRQQFFARLMRNQRKVQVLNARAYAVECFLQGEPPTKTPAGFLSRVAEIGVGEPATVKLERTNEPLGRFSKPA